MKILEHLFNVLLEAIYVQILYFHGSSIIFQLIFSSLQPNVVNVDDDVSPCVTIRNVPYHTYCVMLKTS